MSYEMDPGLFEVTITLTPLGYGEGENHRVIKLNDERKEIEIGRASKNAHKCLVPTSSNAWFDYPILSRAHAKFIIHPFQKVLYIKDCKSTHGTYMGMKLDGGVEYAVDDNEVITFGQRVTSGTVIYPAKDFRVHSKWESRSPLPGSYSSAPLPDPYTQATLSNFQVPDEYDDSPSEHSRESSIQILESHPRTFSVPSTDIDSDSEDSDVESVEIASSIPAERDNYSTATTPEQNAATTKPAVVDIDEDSDSEFPQTTVRGLNLKGPRLVNVLSRTTNRLNAATGDARKDAVTVEDESDHIDHISEVESDSEGPEVLPFGITSSEDKSIKWAEPQISSPLPPALIEMEKEIDTDTEEQARVAEEKYQESRRWSPDLCRDSIVGDSVVEDSDDFDSGDDDGFDHDDFSDIAAHCTPKLFKKMLAGKSYSSVVNGPHMTRQESTVPMQDSSNPPYPDTTNDGVNMNKSINSDYVPYSYPHLHAQDLPRAPSPSDAAMARTLSDAPPAPTSLVGNIHAIGPGVHDIKIGNSSTTDPRVFNSVPFGYQYTHPISYSDPTNVDTHSKPYAQGPFASHFRAISNANSPYAYPSSTFDRSGKFSEQRVPIGFESPYTGSFNDIAADARYAAELQAEEDALAGGPLASEAHISELLRDQSRKGSEGQSSKIDISSLVNASHVESLRPLKRKADEMSTAATIGSEETNHETSWPTSGSPAFQEPPANFSEYSTSVEETQLPDAQNRDDLPCVEPASLTQDAEAVETIPTVPEKQVVETQERPRKKARTSASSSNGVGKFVSGVCVGLVGAFAAFVATIPPSVYEEALREFGNGS